MDWQPVRPVSLALPIGSVRHGDSHKSETKTNTNKTNVCVALLQRFLWSWVTTQSGRYVHETQPDHNCSVRLMGRCPLISAGKRLGKQLWLQAAGRFSLCVCDTQHGTSFFYFSVTLGETRRRFPGSLWFRHQPQSLSGWLTDWSTGISPETQGMTKT